MEYSADLAVSWYGKMAEALSHSGFVGQRDLSKVCSELYEQRKSLEECEG